MTRHRPAAGAPASLKAVAAQVDQLDGPDEMMAQISCKMLDKDKLGSWISQLISSDKGSWLPDEFEKLIGVSPISDVLFNSAFIRAAARVGYVFFIGSDRRVYRHTVKLDSSVPRPAAIKQQGGDNDYFVKPIWYDDLRGFIDDGLTVLLIGPPGSGKTVACEQIFRERDQHLHVVSCNQSMTADDLEGRVELRNDGGTPVTRFEPAALAIASKKGDAVLLDESDAIPAQAAFGLFRLLAGKEMRILRMGEDGIIPRDDRFRIVGTQNTEGRGDDRGLHHGRSYQDEAFLDRWDNVVRVDYPIKPVEADILMKRAGIGQKTADRIVDAARLLRRALAGDEIMFCCSMRRTLSVAKNIARGYDMNRSWSYAVINRATRDDAKNIEAILNRVYGSAFGA